MENIMEKPIMERFKADDSVQIKGEIILGIIKADSDIKIPLLKCLQDNNIIDARTAQWYPESEKWYSYQNLLNALKNISDVFGYVALEKIAREVPKSITFPTKITTEQAFTIWNRVYQNNHQGGDVGYYELLRFDGKKHKLMMKCNTPYPMEFSAGILYGILSRFKPLNSRMFFIEYEFHPDGIHYLLTW